MDYDKLLQGLIDLEQRLSDEEQVLRLQELAGIKQSTIENKYWVKITVAPPDVTLITEHETYKRFKGSTNRYRKDAAQPHIPAQAHYHIVPNNSTKELYSVNIDGTAHHGDNKGHLVPKKEAAELRALGVKIHPSGILENQDIHSAEVYDDTFTVWLVFRSDTTID